MNKTFKFLLIGFASFILLIVMVKACVPDEFKKDNSVPDIKNHYTAALKFIDSGKVVEANEALERMKEIDSTSKEVQEISTKINSELENAISIVDKKIKELLPFVNKKKDDFQKATFYEPTFIKNDYGNKVYCYFSVDDDGTVFDPRFVITYYGDDWIFWNKATFLIDGNNYDFIPQTNPSRDNSSSVWETSDDNMTAQSTSIVMKTFEAKEVKYRLSGNEGVRDFTLPNKQKTALKNIMYLHTAMSTKYKLEKLKNN